MKAPITQEELDYRENLNTRASAISSINSLFSDVEDKSRRLTILKSLIASLHLGDDVVEAIQKEVEAAEEAARKAKEAEEAEAAASEESSSESYTPEEETPESSDDSDLAPMPDEEIVEEELEVVEEPKEEKEDSKTILVEDGILIEDADDLPTPEEADTDRDFTENY
jgi:hypothetical protein